MRTGGAVPRVASLWRQPTSTGADLARESSVASRLSLLPSVSTLFMICRMMLE